MQAAQRRTIGLGILGPDLRCPELVLATHSKPTTARAYWCSSATRYLLHGD